MCIVLKFFRLQNIETEYSSQDGFGWTNGVLLKLIVMYGMPQENTALRRSTASNAPVFAD